MDRWEHTEVCATNYTVYSGSYLGAREDNVCGLEGVEAFATPTKVNKK